MKNKKFIYYYDERKNYRKTISLLFEDIFVGLDKYKEDKVKSKKKIKSCFSEKLFLLLDRFLQAHWQFLL